MKRRVVVTGLGAITPIGIGIKDFWDATLRGDCGTDVITLFDARKWVWLLPKWRSRMHSWTH
jgi:3-oxoacyl-[acyl-carrier-protein] synthase II